MQGLAENHLIEASESKEEENGCYKGAAPVYFIGHHDWQYWGATRYGDTKIFWVEENVFSLL